MTDTPLPPVEPPLPAPKPKLGRGFKLLLAVSLALNLAVAGAVVGVALKARGGDPSRLPIVRDLNFGPFSEALTREQRRDLRRAFMTQSQSPRELQAQLRADLEGVLVALRNQPFDSAALSAALDAQGRRIASGLEAGRRAMEAVIIGMSAEERAGFADRLETALKNGQHRRDGGRDGGREGGRDGGRDGGLGGQP